MAETGLDDVRAIEAVAALLGGPLSPEDLTAASGRAELRSPALPSRGEQLLMLSALHGAGQLNGAFFAALRRRRGARRAAIDAAEAALADGALLPLADVLSTMFGVNDLRGFCQHTLHADVPARPARPAAQATGAALVLKQRSMLRPALFDQLTEAHPEHADAIRLAAAHSLPLAEQFGYLFGAAAATPEPTHHLQVQTRQDAAGRAWVGAELRTPEGQPAGWSQWPADQPPALPMLGALPPGTPLAIVLPAPELAHIDWELAPVGGETLGAALVTSRRLGPLRPPVSLARFNVVEVTAPAAASLFPHAHRAIGAVRMGSRPAFPDLSVVRRTLEGREPVDIVHINAFDAGTGRLSLAPDGPALAPSDLVVTAQASRYASRRMAYLNLCGAVDSVAWVMRLLELGFQAVVAPTEPLSPAVADGVAAAFYGAAVQRKVTLAAALRDAQRAAPEAAGRLALYGEPGTRLRV